MITSILEIEDESDGAPTLCEALSERCIDAMVDHDVTTFAEMCNRHRHEDLTAQQLREHWGNLRTEAVIAEMTPAPIDTPLDGGHKIEGAGIFQVAV